MVMVLIKKRTGRGGALRGRTRVVFDGLSLR